MANEPSDDQDFWGKREEEDRKRYRILTEQMGYRDKDANSIIYQQNWRIGELLKAGKSVEPLLRSIELDPKALGVLPDARMRELEKKQAARALPEQQRSTPDLDAAHAPEPERPAAPEGPTERKRAPNRYALLIERQEHPERAKDIDAELERRKKELERGR